MQGGAGSVTPGLRYEDLVPLMDTGKKKLGRPRAEANTTLAHRMVHKITGKEYHCCVAAPKCTYIRSGAPQKARLLKHSTGCIYLTSKLKLHAEDWSSADSLGLWYILWPGCPDGSYDDNCAWIGKKVGALPDVEEGLTAATAKGDGRPVGPAQKRPRLDELSSPNTPCSSSTQLSQSSIREVTIAAGRKALNQKLNHHVLKLICIRGVVPSLIDSPEWKDFTADANPKYHPASSTTFMTSYIPAEASHIRKIQYTRLQQETNLSITYDGGTTRKPQSVYTVHITTIERKVYFIEGHEASRENHTAEHIKEFIYAVSMRCCTSCFLFITGACISGHGAHRSPPVLCNLLRQCRQYEEGTRTAHGACTDLPEHPQLLSSSPQHGEGYHEAIRVQGCTYY